MALMLGVRVASYCLGGAAVIITHEATKTTTEKLSHWLNANKHNLRHPWRWSRSPDPNPEPNHAVNEPDDAANEPEAPVEEPFPYHSVDSADGAPVCELRAGPKVPESAVTGGDLTLGPSVLTAVNDPEDAVKKPFLYGAVDSSDGAPLCEQRAGPNGPESAVAGGYPMGGPSVLTAVNDTDDAVKKPFLYGAVDAGDGAPLCEPRAGRNEPESAVTGGDPMGGPSVLTAVNDPEDAVKKPFLYGAVDSSDGAPLCEQRAGPHGPESAVTGGDPMGGPSVLTAVNDTDDAVKKPFLYGAVDSGDGAPTCEQRAKPNVPESAATGGDPMGGPSVLTAVIKEAGSADNPDLVPAANAVNSGSVPGPDRPDDANPSFGAAAADGIRGFLSKAVNAVRTWGMKLLRWFPVDGVCNSKGAPGDTGGTVDPDFWDKIGRIRKKILLWAVEYVILERAMKHNKVWRQLYNIVKIELKFTTL